MKLSMLIAWDKDGNVVQTLEYRVIYDETHPDRPPIGLWDFEAHELAGRPLTEAWRVESPDESGQEMVAGSGSWPEWLDAADGFRVELDDRPLVGRGGHFRVKALVHRKSHAKRSRERIESAIRRAIVDARKGLPEGDKPVVDLRLILGGPGKPLRLDDRGRTVQSPPTKKLDVPLIAIGRPE